MLFDDTHTTTPTDYQIRHRAIGAFVGQAVGDALGARYEFGKPGQISREFPLGTPCQHLGGGAFGWDTGEFTDDTQMAVLLAENLLIGEDPRDLANIWAERRQWELWKHWARTARDVGSTTWPPLSAETYEKSRKSRLINGRGNGAVMRVAPVGIAGAVRGVVWTEDVARSQALITHTDPRTVEAAVITAVALAEIISGRRGFQNAIEYAIECHCQREWRDYFYDLLIASDSPSRESNGYGDICLAEAVHAVKTTANFEDAIRHAIDGGNDTDTVACVAGALAGAWYGVQQIPARLTTPIHGRVSVPSGKYGFRTDSARYDLEKIQELATKLIGQVWSMKSPEYHGVLEPVAIGERHGQTVYVCNLAGARHAREDLALMSFCRMFGGADHFRYRREFYLLDESTNEANPNLDFVLSDALAEIEQALFSGRDVLIHCHAGESRTGFIAKAWLMLAYGYTHKQAHEHLAKKWRYYSPRNTAFVRCLDAFRPTGVEVG
jgi:ADP-ribosyl-[dinitrogen reductase] hydrolase